MADLNIRYQLSWSGQAADLVKQGQGQKPCTPCRELRRHLVPLGQLSLFSLSPSLQRDSLLCFLPKTCRSQLGQYGLLLFSLQLFSLSLGSVWWDLLLVMAQCWVIAGAKCCGKVLSSCKSECRCRRRTSVHRCKSLSYISSAVCRVWQGLRCCFVLWMAWVIVSSFPAGCCSHVLSPSSLQPGVTIV